MRTKNVVNSLRLMAQTLVEHDEAQCGSRMLAYYHVGVLAGCSGNRIRALVNGYDGQDFSFRSGVELMLAYHKWASRPLPEYRARSLADILLELDRENGAPSLRTCDAPSLSPSSRYQMEEADT